MSSDVKLDVQDGILLDQFRAYYYLSRHSNNNLRVSKLIQHSLTYTLALVDRGRHLLPPRNNCVIESLESALYRGEKFVKKYVKPVKVCIISLNLKCFEIKLGTLGRQRCSVVRAGDLNTEDPGSSPRHGLLNGIVLGDTRGKFTTLCN